MISAQVNVDPYGRITHAADVTIVLPYSLITGLITSGTLSAGRLPTTGVTCGTYP